MTGITFTPEMSALSGEQQPFVRYRDRLGSYEIVRSAEVSDEQYVNHVMELDGQVSKVWGSGFRVTPLVAAEDLRMQAGAVGSGSLTIKSEVGNVGGSHKSRHLFGVALQRLLSREPRDGSARLAIASCGNAAISAAVIARATELPLDVFVPDWAEVSVIDTLREFGATINVCSRRDGEAGDPCFLRFREAVADGAEPFSVQETETLGTIDGGRTLGWELQEQAPQVDTLFVQVGGGALASAVGTAFSQAALRPVQAAGCAPLRRAWDRLAPGFDFAHAEANPDEYMWPWQPEPVSIATGILDDVTYDWVPLLRQTHLSGGEPTVVAESAIVNAFELARAHTDQRVCTTGVAGLAGWLESDDIATSHAAVLFTGQDRG